MNDEAQLEVRYVPIGDVHPWEKNPKKHNKKAILESIKRFKPTQPILVQKGTHLIIAGHGRLEAFKTLGYAEVPTIELDMSDAEAKAYALVDNETTISGGWDDELLSMNLRDISLEMPDLDMSTFGFTDKQMKREVKEDDFDPESVPNVEPITQPGDLIILGNHRLMCGDSTKKEDVEKLMNGQSIQHAFCDPPFESEDHSWFSFPYTGTVLVMHSEKAMVDLVVAHKREFHYFLVHYYSFGFARSKNMPQLAHHLIGVFGNVKFNCLGDGFKTVLAEQLARDKVSPYQKPIKLIASLLDHYTNGGDMVLDLFGGGGTTLIACEQTGRKCYMMELDPHFCDVIVQRWEAFTDKEAKRL